MLNTTTNPFKDYDIKYISNNETWTLSFIPTENDFLMPFLLREGQEPSKIPLLIEAVQLPKIYEKLKELKPHDSLPYDLFRQAIAGCISIHLKYGD